MPLSSDVETVFFNALEKEGAERDDYLDAVCQGDVEFRRQVEKMLNAHAKLGVFLNRPAIEQFPDVIHAAAATQGPSDTVTGGTSVIDLMQTSSQPGSLGRIGHYEVQRLLGRGAFCSVYEAFDEKLLRPVAIKFLAPELAAMPSACQRFVAEARSSAKIRHANVVQVYAVEEQPHPYLVMELIPGGSLQQLLSRVGRLDVTEVVRIGSEIARGLAASHRIGLVHRDLKPENILLESNEDDPHAIVHAKIGDFGLARAADVAVMSQYGLVSGTPMYMAPEQAAGQPFDQQADLFSLGSVLYTMICGQAPFRGKSTFAVLRRVVENSPPPIQGLVPEAPSWLCEIIARLHSKQPEDRYASAQEVAILLTGHLPRMPSSADVPACPNAPEVATATSQLKIARKQRSRSSTGSQAVMISTVVLILSLLVFGGVGIVATSRVTDLRSALSQLFTAESRKVTDSGRETNLPDRTVDEPSTVQDAWERSVAGLPYDDRAAAVVARLQELNPGFDGSHQDPNFPFDLVLRSDNLRDVSPVRLMPGLQSLFINSRNLNDFKSLRGLELTYFAATCPRVRDLSPLQGMKLVNLDLSATTQVWDLSPLEGMPLKSLTIAYTKVRDLTPLRNMKLQQFNCDSAPVSDLSPLAGMPLTVLGIHRTMVTDLSPIQDMPLVQLQCHETEVGDAELPHLMQCKSLTLLSLQGTLVTESGLNELHSALPNCRITWNGGTIEPK